MSTLSEIHQVYNGRVTKGGKRLCIHWFREVGVEGVWAYFECRCGRRRADRIYANLSGPLDWAWLNGNEFSDAADIVAPPKPPPDHFWPAKPGGLG